MARKTAAVEQKPRTVADRRRALRGREASGGPGVRKVEIDLTKPDARKALAALFPRPENDTLVKATPELEQAALEYVEARDAESLAKERKEVAGNVLCNAIGRNLGIIGTGWKAEWDMSKGNVDWTALVKELNIPDETIAKYRRPDSRGLNVREVAEEA